MNAPDDHPLLPAPRSAPDVLDDECMVLLDALAQAAGTPPRTPFLRERVFDRVARSAHASRAFITLREKDMPVQPLAPGATQRTLYEASTRQLRSGEPRRVRLIELAAGAAWPIGAAPTDLQHEWLVLDGEVQVDGHALGPRDHLVTPSGVGVARVGSRTASRLYLRESSLPALAHDAGQVQRAGDAGQVQRAGDARWDDFAPGIKRRLLWVRGREAAMLYHALPGAGVPRHGHGHDEECLMLEGELFVDDVLLRQGEYQLAPAGTLHGGLTTDTGVVIYARGDLDLDVQPG